jgi:uncharacterized protein
MSLRPTDWLLILLGAKVDGSHRSSLDPVRIQKGMFLLAQETDIPTREKYEFSPYNWGPYSRTLRENLEDLVSVGKVIAQEVPGYSWKQYSLSESGLETARKILPRANRTAAIHVFDIRRQINEASFNSLLNDVYTRFPEFAVNSLFRR